MVNDKLHIFGGDRPYFKRIARLDNCEFFPVKAGLHYKHFSTSSALTIDDGKKGKIRKHFCLWQILKSISFPGKYGKPVLDLPGVQEHPAEARLSRTRSWCTSGEEVENGDIRLKMSIYRIPSVLNHVYDRNALNVQIIPNKGNLALTNFANTGC